LAIKKMNQPEGRPGISRLASPLVLARVLPYAAIAAIILATVVGALLISFRVVSAGLVLVGIPVVLGALASIVFFSRSRDELAPLPPGILAMDSRQFGYLVLVFTILCVLSLSVVFQGGPRPLDYFLTVTMMAGIIFLEILGTEDQHRSRQVLIIVQSTVLGLNLIYSQTLNLPLFFGGGDLIRHMAWIDSILQTGNVTAAVGGYYQYFPLFHIFGAEGVLVLGLDLQTSYFILFGLVFSFSIPLTYLLVKSITGDIRLALMSALSFVLLRETVFNGMYMNTRELAFVFCLAVLFLLLQKDWRMRAMAIFLIIPLVPLHHTTLLHFSMILAAIVALEFVFIPRAQLVGYKFLLLLTVAYVGYWFLFAYPFVDHYVFQAVPSEMVAPPVEEGLGTTNLLFTGLRNVDYLMLGFIMFIGVISQLRQDRQAPTVRHVFAIFGLLGFLVFIPDIAAVFNPILHAYRLSLLVSPVIAFIFAAGILAILTRLLHFRADRTGAAAALSLVTVVVMVFSFSSQFLMSSLTDVDLTALGSTSPRRYFTKAELASFAMFSRYAGDTAIYTDMHTGLYLEAKYNMLSNYSTDAIHVGETEASGYLVLRDKALTEKEVLAFDPRGLSRMYHGTYVYRVGDEPDLKELWRDERLIYTDGDILIYLK
jgi:hypothetical protein